MGKWGRTCTGISHQGPKRRRPLPMHREKGKQGRRLNEAQIIYNCTADFRHLLAQLLYGHWYCKLVSGYYVVRI